MFTLIVVPVIFLIFGVIIAISCGQDTRFGLEPNLGGCLTVLIAIVALIFIGAMYLGKWLL